MRLNPLLLLGFLFIFHTSLSYARDISFSKSLPISTILLIKHDLAYPTEFVSDSDVQNIFGLPSLSDSDIKTWLTDRVGFVISENEDLLAHQLDLGAAAYPEKNILPLFEPGPPDLKEAFSKVLKAPIRNLGGALYYFGKVQDILMGYSFNQETLPITSPRVGLIQVGPLYSKMVLAGTTQRSMVDTYWRIANLLHEARHSDGNGQSLGFPHAICPDGKEYEGLPECDRAGNGPYAIAANFLKAAIKTCRQQKTCTEGEAELLSFLAIDYEGRVIDKGAIWDDRPESL